MPDFTSVALQFSGATQAGLAATRADLIITESGIASGAQTLTGADLAALATGGQTVLAYVNTSVTDASRSYWDAAWVTPTNPSNGDIGTINPSAPAWLAGNLGGVDFDAANAGPDAFIVDYRNADWRALVISQAVAQVQAGYGGVFLDDVGRYYEAGNSGGTYDPALADAMMQLVIDVATAVRAVNANAVIVVNSGVYIGGDSTGGTAGALFTQYRAAIDGVLIENQFTAGTNAVWAAAQSLYPTHTLIALESLARAPDVEALLNFAAASGVLLQLAPDEGYDDPVRPPILGTAAGEQVTGRATFINTMAGGAGNDSMLGGFADDTIYGQAGADFVMAGNGNDSVFGGSEGDTIYGGAGSDWLDGGAGSDRLFGGADADTIYGGGGSDGVYGDAGNDRLFDVSGFNSLFGGDGEDSMYGGGALMTYRAGAGHDLVEGGAGEDWAYGEDGDDILYGGGFLDRLNGDAGNDTLYGGDDNDSLEGGADSDLLYAGAGQDKSYGDAGNDILYGGADADSLRGDGGNDTLFGDDGNDTVLGGDGDDSVSGSAGSDKVYGERGADVLNGDGGHDTLYGWNENDILYGGTENDALYGGFGADQLFGGIGNDTLWGDTDNDHVQGDAGRDRLFGGSFNDTLDGGDDNDSLWGDVGNDTLLGGSGVDQLFGGIGNDSLNGGAGHDLLTGGSLRDIFVFAGNAGRDRVMDFEQGRDRVDLSAYDPTWAEVRGALSIKGGIVRLDLADLGGSGWVDFAGQRNLAQFTAADFVL